VNDNEQYSFRPRYTALTISSHYSASQTVTWHTAIVYRAFSH